MEILKESLVCEKNTDKVICNVCASEIPKDKFGYFQDYIHIDKNWGYNSNKDGEKTTMDICQACFDKFIENCKIKP